MLKEILPLRLKKRKLKWGVAGLGKFSETAVLPTLQKIRRAKTQAVYSKSIERAKTLGEKFSIPHCFDNFQEFLASDFDAVYIGSNNADHYEQVLLSAKAGKHVLCDKPLAVTAEQAARMVETCRQYNVFFAVNYVYRFHPLIQKAKELIAKQTIGKLVSIDAHFNVNYAPDDNFRFTKELSGGGAMRDLGTHMIDILRYLNGEMTPLYGCLDNIVYKSEVEDFATGLFRFESGGYGYVNVSFNVPRAANRIEILGHRGSIEIENLVATRLGSSKMKIVIEGEARKAFRKRTNKLLSLMKSVNTSFLRGEEPLVTGEDGLVNMRLMEALEAYDTKK
ncbi:MAG: Gfo/Idh/MocA family oxidoreductase [Ignavibacteriales bacterium]|nr:Gfo/Idh/MocA family oxidoreductase [Ignavibacteriales bacterium]